MALPSSTGSDQLVLLSKPSNLFTNEESHRYDGTCQSCPRTPIPWGPIVRWPRSSETGCTVWAMRFWSHPSHHAHTMPPNSSTESLLPTHPPYADWWQSHESRWQFPNVPEDVLYSSPGVEAPQEVLMAHVESWSFRIDTLWHPLWSFLRHGWLRRGGWQGLPCFLSHHGWRQGSSLWRRCWLLPLERTNGGVIFGGIDGGGNGSFRDSAASRQLEIFFSSATITDLSSLSFFTASRCSFMYSVRRSHKLTKDFRSGSLPAGPWQ